MDSCRRTCPASATSTTICRSRAYSARARSSRSLLNTATLAVSRLSMNHTTQSANKNDIVGQLGIQGVGFGGPGAWGAPYFNVQGYSPIGDSYSATPMHAWDTVIEGRDTLSWQWGATA